MAKTELHNLDTILTHLTQLDLNQFDSVDGILAYTTEAVAKALNVERVGIWELSENGLNLKTQYSLSQKNFSSGVFLEKRKYVKYFNAISKGLIIEANDALKHPDTQEFADSYLKPNNITSMLDLPLRVAGRLEGVLCCEHLGNQRKWLPSEVVFAKMAANILAMSIGHFELLKLQRKIEEEHHLLKQIVDNLPALIFLKDRDSKLLMANKMDLEYIGFQDEKNILGKTDFDYFPQKLAERSIQEDEGILKSAKGITGKEFDHVHPKTGEKRNLMVSKIPLKRNGEIMGILGIGLDITERVRKDELIRKNEERFRFIAENTSDGIFVTDNQLLTYYSPACEKIMGYTHDEMLELSRGDLLSLVHPEDVDYARERLMKAIQNQERTVLLKYRARRKSGEYFWRENTVNNFYDQDGKLWRSVVIIRDLSESLKAEHELKESEERFRFISDNTTDGIMVLENGKITYYSPACYHILGYSLEEILRESKKDPLTLLHPDDKELVRERLKEAVKNKVKTVHLRHRTRMKSGEYFWQENVVHYFYDESGWVWRTIIIIRDVTEAWRAEQQFKTQQKLVSDILNSLDEAVWALSLPETKPLFVSKSFEELYGFSMEDWEKDPHIWEKVIYEEDNWVVPYYRPDWKSGKSINATVRIKSENEDGYRWVENIVKTAYNDQGEPYLLLGIGLDRTEKVKAEQKLIEVNKRITKAEKAKADLELRTLQMQMNPHFIFNALNSIQSFILKNDVEATNDYLSKFASLIRSFLDSSRSLNVSIRDEIRLLKLYLEMEQMRFEEMFDYEINVDPEVDIQRPIPGMLLQPFVENSINHSLRYKESKGKLRILFKQENDITSCTIEDDGVGRERAHEIRSKVNKGYVSQGLKITKERLDTYNLLNRTNLKFEIEDLNPYKKDKGTRVKIYFPE